MLLLSVTLLRTKSSEPPPVNRDGPFTLKPSIQTLEVLLSVNPPTVTVAPAAGMTTTFELGFRLVTVSRGYVPVCPSTRVPAVAAATGALRLPPAATVTVRVVVGVVAPDGGGGGGATALVVPGT